MVATPRPLLTRRRVLTGLLLLPPALAGCSLNAGAPPEQDPLIALADAARADAALAAAAIAAGPDLADRVQPFVDARTEHAKALDAEVRRLDPGRADAAPVVPATPAAPRDPAPTLERVRAAALASGMNAADAAFELPADRVGLVASIVACCSAYAAVLT